jgi:hypothetical protein
MTLAGGNWHEGKAMRALRMLDLEREGDRAVYLGSFRNLGGLRNLIPGRLSRSNSAESGAGKIIILLLLVCLASTTGCATTSSYVDVYHDPAMDFPAIRTVAILPFVNLSQNPMGAERARDVFSNALLATEAFYVLPSGEVSRGINRTGMINRTDPSPDEIVRFAGIIGADAVITGVVREYGSVRSGSISANTISLSLRMVEAETGTVVWSASSTKGGITTWIRLFGGGGKPMNEVTREAVEELLDSLFI